MTTGKISTCVQGHIKLWRRVLLLAVYDACYDGINVAMIAEKRSAREFLTSDSEHFNVVCDSIDADPVKVRNRIQALLCNESLRKQYRDSYQGLTSEPLNVLTT